MRLGARRTLLASARTYSWWVISAFPKSAASPRVASAVMIDSQSNPSSASDSSSAAWLS